MHRPGAIAFAPDYKHPHDLAFGRLFESVLYWLSEKPTAPRLRPSNDNTALRHFDLRRASTGRLSGKTARVPFQKKWSVLYIIEAVIEGRPPPANYLNSFASYTRFEQAKPARIQFQPFNGS
jgi:hypothetical protein